MPGATQVALCAVLALSAALTLPAQGSKETERLANSGVVLEEVLAIPENVPEEILNKAQCVIVIPSMTKVALGIGGSYGRGAMACRSGSAHNGPWGAPAMYAIEGASVGFQLGAEATDLVLMVMNARGVNALLTSSVKLGAQASVAAGPKGRHVEAATDASMRAELLSYSRSRGLFAGVSIEGTSLRPDDDANEQVYGRRLSAKEIINGTSVTVPPAGRRMIDVLQKYSPQAKGTPSQPERTR
jgi:lipid-binding SYLF domain-containing protein